MITLYKKHKKSIGIWTIRSSHGDRIIIEHSTTLHGKRVYHEELIAEGKQGRTQAQQIQSRTESRVNKQLDKGYVRTQEEASVAPTNTLGLAQPMLAIQHKNAKNLTLSPCYQPKLDGHRCLIRREGNVVVAYTRQGKPITTISHITDELVKVMGDGVTLDGELYIHGMLLQDIGSLIKRQQPDTIKLKFWAYDIIDSAPYRMRYSYIRCIVSGLKYSRLTPASFGYKPDVMPLLKKLINKGYEGLMIRVSDVGYEAGRRSNSLIKVKAMLDSEFKVVGINLSDKGRVVLACLTNGGLEFGVSAPGTNEEKQVVYDNAERYIGTLVTVEFSGRTKDGIPFHPVAIRFRDDV